MATDQITIPKSRPLPTSAGEAERQAAPRSQPPLWRRVVQPLASLKLTVVLMALSIFIVLAGTFAQTRIDIWDAIRQYFRIDLTRAFTSTFPFLHPGELFVWIDLKLFFPPSFFPADPVFPEGLTWMSTIWPTQGMVQSIPDWVGIWFPRGWTIGVVMVANLLAAHCLRFKLQSTGTRLWTGLGVLGLGLVVTWAVVATHTDGLANESWLSYPLLWALLNLGLFATSAACIYRAVATAGSTVKERLAWIGAALVVGCLGGVGAAMGTPAPESMRILYQLIKGSLAALVLLAGCWLIFRKRAGIVLLHGGVGLLMAYEVLVGTQHVEMQMTIAEGDRTNFAYDSRAVELAVVDQNLSDQERHVVIDQSLLTTGATISDPRLPFDLKVVEFLSNALPERMSPGEKSTATHGLGKVQRLVPMEKSVGTESQADFPGAYVQVIRKGATGDAANLGIYMLSTALDPALQLFPFVEQLELPTAVAAAQPQKFDLALRFVRHYKDYELELVDFQKNDYAGTVNARDFRSVVNMYGTDGAHRLDQYHIWMNNPLRFGGETFYQSEFRPEAAKPTTVLQVVQNEGWMAPYVACMIVAAGMFYQFGIGLTRFFDRLGRNVADRSAVRHLAERGSDPLDEDESTAGVDAADRGTISDNGILQRRPALAWGVPLGIAALVILSIIGYGARQRKIVKDDFQLSAFADLPVVMGGRSLPLESVAMMRLMQISDLQSFKEKDPDPTDDDKPKSQPASKWLLDMVARPEIADQYPVFRIENDVLATSLGLEINSARRYAYADFQAKLPELREQMKGVNQKPKDQRTVDERKRAELLSNVSQYLDLRGWFGDLEATMRSDFPQLFVEGQDKIQRATALLDMVRRLGMFAEESKEFRVPLVIPLHVGKAEGSITRFGQLQRRWETYPVASGFRGLDRALGVDSPPAVTKFDAILAAWKAQDAKAFNAAVADYRSLLATATPEELTIDNAQVSLAKGAFEGYYNRFGAFNLLSFAYVFALLLTLAGWGAAGLGGFGWSNLLQRSALWTMIGLLALHTAAIIGRIYISGRPPVTNLYSSAIFIGWAAVLVGLVFEGLFKMGIGNAAASLAGFTTLRIAHALMSDGDTLGVVEAVLDTQFWLATHVVCITLGYAATYLAGIFGLMYVLRGSRLGLFVLAAVTVLGGVLGISTGSVAGISAGSLANVCGLAAAVLGIYLQRSDDQVFTAQIQKTLARMIYGTLCGATFLSFVGTVLGGLWADDSWGRFWGWDPKENGALIIVMWNALILHARWDGMIRERGTAALAILGNIVTSWSWFGVNELGIGLHSYGFTEGRLFWLMVFCLSQLAIFAVACLPRSTWWGEERAAAVG